jgi:voltage-gated potassium channel Kch
MLLPLLTGAALVVLTVLIHAFGATYLIQLLARHYTDEQGDVRPRRAGLALAVASIGLLLLHWIQILIWAGAYLLLEPVSPIRDFATAVYFSAVTFTTLGYGDIVLESAQWRLLTGIEALNGVLLLGLSTALLLGVVHNGWRSLLKTPAQPGP